MSLRMSNRYFASLVLVSLLANAGGDGQTWFGVAGVVRDTQGNPLPGATVTVTERGMTRAQVVTDENGAFNVAELSAGAYEASATIAGFRSETQAFKTDSPVTRLEFTLRARVLEHILWVVPRPSEALNRADAIAHLRIESTLPPRPCGDAPVVAAIHEARVLAAWKGMLAPSIRLAQEAAGMCFDGAIAVKGVEPAYQAGEEYVVFLQASGDRFRRMAGPALAFRVRDGLVLTKGFAGLAEVMDLAQFRAELERLARLEVR